MGIRAARGLASTEMSFHSCNVLRDCRRASPGQTKMKAGVCKNDDFFAIVVRITGKLL